MSGNTLGENKMYIIRMISGGKPQIQKRTPRVIKHSGKIQAN